MVEPSTSNWNPRRIETFVDGPQKWLSAVSCSNLALRILKLRRENFKQTGSSIFKIGRELRSPQSIESETTLPSDDTFRAAAHSVDTSVGNLHSGFCDMKEY